MLQRNLDKVKRVIFDFDDTLITHDTENEASYLCELLSIPWEFQKNFEKELKNFFSSQSNFFKNRKVTMDAYLYMVTSLMPCLQELDIMPEEFNEAVFENNIHLTKLSEDVIHTLEYLVNKNYLLYMWTNGWYGFQSRLMKKHGILHYFERVYAWDDQYAKPDIRSINRVIKGTLPLENVIVGDNLENEIAVAKAKLIPTIWLKQSGKEHSGKIKPDYTISKIEELKFIL